MTLQAANGPRWVSPDGLIDLRLGRWQDVLADVEVCDAVITDPPYSEKTHDGQHALRDSFGYDAMGPGNVGQLVYSWAERCSGWMACMTDDVLAPHYRGNYDGAGLYDFAPVPILQHRPRLTGDGPGSGAVYLMVGRPREKRFLSWGSLPCWYEARPERGAAVVGAKPLGLMRAIVRDYSRAGDLVVDPYAGGGTTLLAAAMEGRRSIGAECDPDTYAKAVARLSRGMQPDLFSGVAP